MVKNKRKKFAENAQNPHIVEPGKELFDQVKDNWDQSFFRNGQPVILELGCGRGEYTVAMAENYPHLNYLGVDIKGARIWHGAFEALNKGLSNAGFLRVQIANLTDYIGDNEASGIWLTFPDPRPKGSDEKRRLTHPRYLEMYKRVLNSGGFVKLKTDNPVIFEYTLEVLQDQPIRDLVYTRDLYRSDLLEEHEGIQTNYEKRFLNRGSEIRYLRFRFE